MNIINLTPQQEGVVSNFLEELKKENPQLDWVSYPMSESPPGFKEMGDFLAGEAKPHPSHYIVHPEISKDFEERLLLIEQKVDAVLNRLEAIFGDQVLINGRFLDLTKNFK